MRCVSWIAAFALTFVTGAYAADDLAVDVVNASEPTLCAEKDNIYLKLASPEVRRFKVEAVHPNYIGTIVVDRSAFDLHNCPDLAAAPLITEQPRRVTIYETPDLQLVGLTIPNFWRKGPVPVRVGDRVERGVQLLQLWVRANDRAEEVLVLYPTDGYWRAAAAALQSEMERLLRRLCRAVESRNAAGYPESCSIPYSLVPPHSPRRGCDLALRRSKGSAVPTDADRSAIAVRGATLDVRPRITTMWRISAGGRRGSAWERARSCISIAPSRSKSGLPARAARHNPRAGYGVSRFQGT